MNATALYCTLHFTALHCTSLHFTALAPLHCTALHCAALHYTTLQVANHFVHLDESESDSTKSTVVLDTVEGVPDSDDAVPTFGMDFRYEVQV